MFDRLFELLQAVWDSLWPWVILQPWEQGVLIRQGKVQRTLGPGGFHWILPFGIDKPWHENVTPTTHHLAGLSTTTKDGKAIGFDAVITYQITDAEKAILKVQAVSDAVIDTCMGVIGTELSEATWEDILHGRVTDSLSKACRAKGWKWGIEIMSVQLAGVCLVKNIRLSGNSGAHEMTVSHLA